MSQDVKNAFNFLIQRLTQEGWNDDIIDDVKILKRKYLKEKEEEDEL